MATQPWVVFCLILDTTFALPSSCTKYGTSYLASSDFLPNQVNRLALGSLFVAMAARLRAEHSARVDEASLGRLLAVNDVDGFKYMSRLSVCFDALQRNSELNCYSLKLLCFS